MIHTRYFFLPLLLSVTFLSSGQNCLTLVAGDEFNYAGLPDPAKWSYDVAGPGWVNNELQNYVGGRSENSRVENGNLIIEAREDWFDGHRYSSARLNGNYKTMSNYGRVEFRAKLPIGRGTWPALWLMPTDIYRHATTCSAQTGWVSGCDAWPNSGEIDVMEYVGYQPGVIHGSVHTKNANFMLGNNFTRSTGITNEGSEFHVYALERTEDYMEWFIDDVSYARYDRPGTGWEDWPFDQAFYPILNIAIGGDWGGIQGVDASIFPVQMVVDYVRLYEFGGGGNQAPYQGVMAPIPGLIEAENYDEGCAGESYSDTDGGNNGQDYRSDGVDIETDGTTTNIGWTEDGEWLEYTVDVSLTGPYYVDLTTASLQEGGEISIEVDGVPIVTQQALPVTGDWSAWQTTRVDGFSMSQGQHALKVTIDKGGFNLDHLAFDSDISSVKSSHTEIAQVYPNPFEDHLNIASKGISQYSIHGVSGELIKSGQVTGEEQITMDVDPGVYFVHLKSNAGTEVHRVVK